MSQKGYSLISTRGAILFEKRHLLLLVLIGVLFTIGAIVSIIVGIKKVIDEHSPRVEVCRNALSPTGYNQYSCLSTGSPLRYERTEFSSPDTVTVIFNDGINDEWCGMQRHGSEWVVTSKGGTMTEPCP